MPLTAEQRSMRSRAAAYAMHSRHDARVTGAKGRLTFLNSFEQKVDPDGVLPPAERARRAQAALKAHMSGLALKSSKARRSA